VGTHPLALWTDPFITGIHKKLFWKYWGLNSGPFHQLFFVMGFFEIGLENYLPNWYLPGCL
jgi:hypothetical protein